MAWSLKAHPLFEKDLKELDKTERKIVYRLLEKIRENPERYKKLKHLTNCYSVRIKNLRIIYYLERNTIVILIVGKRKKVYKEMKRRIGKS
jgi:mRNA-degrading endonuclease RelE of RelBE toxin-antitoxin system